MFDYGLIQNFAIYKQMEPPFYNLSNILTPVALIYAEGDALISPHVRSIDYVLLRSFIIFSFIIYSIMHIVF
jgi:hypothetical protein